MDQDRSAPSRYTGTAIALHWIMALALPLTFAVGLYMSDLPFSPQRLRLFNWHKWAGITLLGLATLRLLWRLTHRAPALPAATPRPQALAAHAVHGLVYLLLFLVPLAGWAYSSAAGFHVVWLGVVPLPDLAPVDKALAALLKERHELLAWTLAALVAAHIGAALKHQFVDRDGLIGRMLPRGGGRGPDPAG
jgi:cytochrome b561